MLIYSKFKSKLFLDKYLIFMFASITVVTLYTLYTSIFDLTFAGWIDDFVIEVNRQRILNNMYIFGVSPLQNAPIIHASDFLDLGGGAITTIGPIDFIQSYHLLSYHPSWILNSILTRLTITSHLSLVFTGIIIATFVYRNGSTVPKNMKTRDIIKKQILTALYFAMALLLIVSILGFVVGYIRYTQVRSTETMQLLMSLHNIENLWQPNMLYYMQAVFGTLIHLFSFAVFGIFIGHLLKEGLIAFASLLFLVNNFSLLFNYPISPYYFLPRLSGYFIMPAFDFLVIIDDSFAFSLARLAIYLIIIVFISTKLLGLRLKNISSPLRELNESEKINNGSDQ